MTFVPYGLLRSRIRLLAPTRAANGAGGFTTSYVQVAVIRGERTQSKREAVEKTTGGQPRVSEEVELNLDTRAHRIDSSYRVQTDDGLTYEILSLTDQGGIAYARGRRVD